MPPIGTTVTKDPAAQRVYAIEWVDELGTATIAASQWAITGPDSALTFDSDSISGTLTQLRVSGGTTGVRYRVTNIVTKSGVPTQVEPRSFYVKVASQ